MRIRRSREGGDSRAHQLIDNLVIVVEQASQLSSYVTRGHQTKVPKKECKVAATGSRSGPSCIKRIQRFLRERIAFLADDLAKLNFHVRTLVLRQSCVRLNSESGIKDQRKIEVRPIKHSTIALVKRRKLGRKQRQNVIIGSISRQATAVSVQQVYRQELTHGSRR